MSTYIERWCEIHEEWEQDIDSPYEECPGCAEAGIAPSQKQKALNDATYKLVQDVITVSEKFINKVETYRARSVETYSDLQKLKAKAEALKTMLM